MLEMLYDDLQNFLLQYLDEVSIIILHHANKKYHSLTTTIGKEMKYSRVLNSEKIVALGYLKVLKWAKTTLNIPWNESTCMVAARNGHLDVLKWLKENECCWNEWTCTYSARNGHLEVLKWARKQGCPWNAKTCSSAAFGGHLEILKWARKNGCSWDEWTCFDAAKKGYLEVLKWARSQGCSLITAMDEIKAFETHDFAKALKVVKSA